MVYFLKIRKYLHKFHALSEIYNRFLREYYRNITRQCSY